jgi:membrane fusion protein
MATEQHGFAASQLSDCPANLLKDIFRKDALDGMRAGLGTPVKPIGLGVTVLSIFLASLVVAIGLFLAMARYARKETVFGQITPSEGAFKISTQLAGIAARVHVKEGQVVKAGAELMSISSDPVLGNGESLVEGLKSIQTVQRRAQELQTVARAAQIDRQIDELTARRDGLQSDIARLSDAAVLLERRKHLQFQNVDAHRKLASQGMVSAAAVRQQEDGLLGMQQQIQQSARELGQQRSQLAQVLAQIGRLHAEAELAKSDAAALTAQLHEHELNLEALHAGRVVAPIDGVVTALRVHSGSAVSPGQTLAVIVPGTAAAPAGRLEVELWAPSKAVGFVRPGAHVRIMYDAFPYQTFGVGHGVVVDVSGTPLPPSELSLPLDSHEQLFRIRVSLTDPNLVAYGRAWALVPGMRLSADLILEEQSLMDWVLGPLRALNKRAI